MKCCTLQVWFSFFYMEHFVNIAKNLCLNFVMLYCCSNGAVWRFQVYMYCLCLSVCPSSMKSYAPCVKMASCVTIMGVQGVVCWYACKRIFGPVIFCINGKNFSSILLCIWTFCAKDGDYDSKFFFWKKLSAING